MRFDLASITEPYIGGILADRDPGPWVLEIARAREAAVTDCTPQPPFRADHVGSLLRPAALKEAFRAFREGDIGAEELSAAQDFAIRDAVAMQEDVGLRSITDGEFRRRSYWARFVERVEGLEARDALFQFRDDHGAQTSFTAPHVSGKVRRSGPVACDEFLFLKQATSQTPKITLPSPPTMHF